MKRCSEEKWWATKQGLVRGAVQLAHDDQTMMSAHVPLRSPDMALDQELELPAPLEAEGMVLRVWEPEDATGYVESRDAEVFRWTNESPDMTVEQARRAIEKYRARPTHIGFAIAARDTRATLGNIAVIGDEGKKGEMSFWLAPAGVLSADAVYFPVDPMHALGPLRSEVSEISIEGSETRAHHINVSVAAGARRWLFRRPRSTPLEGVELPPVREAHYVRADRWVDQQGKIHELSVMYRG